MDGVPQFPQGLVFFDRQALVPSESIIYSVRLDHNFMIMPSGVMAAISTQE